MKIALYSALWQQLSLSPNGSHLSPKTSFHQWNPSNRQSHWTGEHVKNAPINLQPCVLTIPIQVEVQSKRTTHVSPSSQCVANSLHKCLVTDPDLFFTFLSIRCLANLR